MKVIDKLKARLESKKISSDNVYTGMILVVQQDIDKLKHLKKLIETCCPHCLVLGYTNGDEALNLIKNKGTCVDLCFSDVEQEGVGGFELNSAMMAIERNVMVLTTRSSKYALAARQAGIKGYILFQHMTLERIAYEIYHANENLMRGCDSRVNELAKKICLTDYL